MFIAMMLRTTDALVVSSLFVSSSPRPNLRFARLNFRSTSIQSVLSIYAIFFSALLSASFFGLPSLLPERRMPCSLQYTEMSNVISGQYVSSLCRLVIDIDFNGRIDVNDKALLEEALNEQNPVKAFFGFVR